MSSGTIGGRLRQPEHTGENRCMPCTVVNTAIAIALAAGIGWVLVPAAGGLALVLFAGAIYLRGYLVPGTPQLTQRYFPEWLLRAFGKEPLPPEAGRQGAGDTAGGGAATASGYDGVEDLYVSTGIAEECDDRDDLCLTEAFGDVWWRRIRALREDDERARARLGMEMDVDPDAIEFQDDGRFSVTVDGEVAAQWASDAAFYADLAAKPTVEEWIPDWEGYTGTQRTELLAGMRVFLESCPACEADLEQVQDVRESCCSGEFVSVSLDCGSCGAQLFSGTYQ